MGLGSRGIAGGISTASQIVIKDGCVACANLRLNLLRDLNVLDFHLTDQTFAQKEVRIFTVVAL